MGKIKFESEFEIKASPQMLYPYISTASGLSEWYAEDVNFDADKNFIFLYDGEEHKAKLATSRLNSMVRFEFFDDEDDPSTLEFRLTRNDFTQTLFVQVIEYAEIYDEDEQEEMWEGLMGDLRATIGS